MMTNDLEMKTRYESDKSEIAAYVAEIAAGIIAGVDKNVGDDLIVAAFVMNAGLIQKGMPCIINKTQNLYLNLAGRIAIVEVPACEVDTYKAKSKAVTAWAKLHVMPA